MKIHWNQDRPYFDFTYGDTSFFAADIQRETMRTDDTHTVYIYRHPDGLTVTAKVTAYPAYPALRWVLYFENTGCADTRPIREMHDCHLVSDGWNKRYTPKPANLVAAENCAFVYRHIGSNWVRDEYNAYAERLAPGDARAYENPTGRSCEGLAPYFEVEDGELGLLLAIGWTGHWSARFAMDNEGGLTIDAGLPDADFYLKPGERLRTASMVILPYENGSEEGHNAFRRLVKNEFSPMGKNTVPAHGPLCVSAWGAMTSEQMVRKLYALRQYDVPADLYWIDAGWYGHSETDCPNEFIGDWGAHTGSWNVNPHCHPDEMESVAAACAENGYGMLLWFEPERALHGTDWQRAHPEWFLETGPNDWSVLLDLGNPEAWNAAFAMLDGYIKRFRLQCYRQDFNFDPLPIWRANDEEGRRGIHEIRHIMGLYRLWDALLSANPGLFIDNCASGGRRNDIEMLSRSIPLWRSDAQCPGDAPPETAQCHTTGIARWIPYSGTGIGILTGDWYRSRSCYGPAMTTEAWMYADQEIDAETTAAMCPIFAEYLRVRPYLTADFYSIASDATGDDVWCCHQYNRPEDGDGILLCFRRPKSVYDRAVLRLRGLDPTATYAFTDADSGETVCRTGEEASRFSMEIHEPRSSRLLFYHRT